MTIVLDGTNGITTPDLESSGPVVGTTGTLTALTVNGNNISAVNSFGFRNRIINGDMRIDQRNAGASVTPSTGTYSVDRWRGFSSQASKFTLQQNSGGVTPPVGFTNYLGAVSSAATSPGSNDLYLIQQFVEGYNTADLAWGTANAQAVTLSFWVRSSLTGTFGGSLQNDAGDRVYPFSYTINSANTWEYKTVAIAGPTSGTWNTTTSKGIALSFALGAGSTVSGTAGAWASASGIYGVTGAVQVVGTNGATFYITGVQLEAGTVATPFERRDYGRELMMCQRYYSKSYDIGTAVGTNTGYDQADVSTGNTGSTGYYQVGKRRFAVTMRSTPTISLWSYDGIASNWHAGVAGVSQTQYSASTNFVSSSGLGIQMTGVNTTYNTSYGHWAASAEL